MIASPGSGDIAEGEAAPKPRFKPGIARHLALDIMESCMTQVSSAAAQAYPVYEKLEQSALWQHLDAQRGDHAIGALCANVREAASAAAHLLDTIARHMPLYTLHTERRILNIIGWMESLLGSEGIRQLSPLETALAILAAYTHDLGMSLDEPEQRDILDEKSDSKPTCSPITFARPTPQMRQAALANACSTSPARRCSRFKSETRMRRSRSRLNSAAP